MTDLGLSILASGLNADTAELDTASNNLSNINTPGYAREAVELSPVGAAEPLQSGGGVSITSVQALTDAVYGSANIAAAGIQGAANQVNQVMQSVEAIFPEPDATGLAAQLSSFWSDVSNLAANPNQQGAQQTVATAAQNLVSTFNTSSTQLSQLADSLEAEVGTGANDGGTLAQANGLLTQIASLNQGIVAGTTGGQDPNSLGDEQRNDINQLAGLLGVSTSTGSDGSVTVSLGGVQLVSGDVAQTLVSSGSAATGNLAIATSTGAPVTAGGTIGATLASVDTVLPGYQAQLSSVADSLADSVNSAQAAGMDANGDPGSAIAGGYGGTVLPNIFVNGGSNSTYTDGPTSAMTIAVSSAYSADPSLIATAAAPGPGNSNVIGTPTLDATNAQAMAALAGSATGPDAVYQGMIGALGTQAANASNTATTATNMATTAANNLASVSGVNENEEEIDIMTAQNAFQAASQAVNAIVQSFQSLLQAV